MDEETHVRQLGAGRQILALNGYPFTVVLLESLLFGVRGLDPITFAGAALLFAVVAVSASYLPARRAARVDPVVALRSE